LIEKLVFPGDTVDAEIKIIAVEYFQNKLTEGMEFKFMEGPITIGAGKIEQILNARLKKAGR
jgi:translation elongation factor EF-Tu-like GTPase